MKSSSGIPIALVALVLVALTLMGSACESGRSGSATAERTANIPFTDEGTLSFTRADGSEVTTIRIEIADDDSTRTRGLMQRTDLPADAGMLFVFPDETVRSFWMANTPLSLDLMFITSEGVIIDVQKYTKPLSPENVTSSAPAAYVLEVKAGFSDTWGISETDEIEWSEHE